VVQIDWAPVLPDLPQLQRRMGRARRLPYLSLSYIRNRK